MDTPTSSSRSTRIVKQWSSKVLSFSSEYSHIWSADSITGPATVYPRYGHIKGTWAPHAKACGMEFIEIQFPDKIFIQGIDIYETYKSGAVVRICCKAPDGQWVDVYASNTPELIQRSRVFQPKIKTTNFLCNELMLFLDCSAAEGWIEIDAVMITGHDGHTPNSYTESEPDFSELFHSKMFTNVTFEVEGHLHKAHRAILVTRSAYFRAMFSDRFSERDPVQCIPIPDVTSDAFDNLLQYIYTDNIKSGTRQEELIELLRVADRFSLDMLVKLCTYRICMSINEDNVLSIYTEATETLPVLDDVQDKCIEYISSHINEVTNRWEFLSLPRDSIMDIFQQIGTKLSIKFL